MLQYKYQICKTKNIRMLLAVLLNNFVQSGWDAKWLKFGKLEHLKKCMEKD